MCPFPKEWLCLHALTLKLSLSVLMFFTIFVASHYALSSETIKNKPSVTKAPCAKHNVLVKKPRKLKKHLKKACPGSVIRLSEGVWKDILIMVDRSGSQEHPITIKADKPGKTFIEGKSSLEIMGKYVHAEGFVFRNGSPMNKEGAIVVYNSHNRLREMTIDGFDVDPIHKKTHWITINGFHHDISHNHIKNKSTRGVMLVVRREDDRPQNHKIYNNHFENFSSGNKQNGWETIRIGTSDQSTTDSYTLIENNRFDQCDGEIEIISIKSGKNIIRGNTFVNNEGLVTLRHGTQNVVENNVFLLEDKKGGGGVRVYDKGHTIRNNYFSGIRSFSASRGAVVLQSGSNMPGTDANSLNSHWTPYDITVENNTFYNSNQNYVFDDKRKFSVKNVQFKGNVVVPAPGSKVIRVDKEPIALSFENEHYFGTLDDLYEGAYENFELDQGMSFSKFLLKQNTQGLWLHESLGAQNLTLLNKDDVGPLTY